MRDNIKSRMQEVRIYSVLFRLEGSDRLYLSLFLAYSLDDVYEMVKFRTPPEEQWLPIMWQSYILTDLVNISKSRLDLEKIEEVVVEPKPADIKNELMQKIIVTKDESLFKNNEHMFSPSEKKYIKSKIKDDGKGK
jgi:hypothetical protein